MVVWKIVKFSPTLMHLMVYLKLVFRIIIAPLSSIPSSLLFVAVALSCTALCLWFLDAMPRTTKHLIRSKQYYFGVICFYYLHYFSICIHWWSRCPKYNTSNTCTTAAYSLGAPNTMPWGSCIDHSCPCWHCSPFKSGEFIGDPSSTSFPLKVTFLFDVVTWADEPTPCRNRILPNKIG